MTAQQILQMSLRQTDCAPQVVRYGCYAWTLAMPAQLRTGHLMTRQIFDAALEEGRSRQRWDGKAVVGDEVTLGDPEAWGQLCLDVLAPNRYKIWQVGTSEQWFVDQPWYKGPVTKDYSFLAMRWGRPNGDHWTYYDPYAGVAWDPHGGLRPLNPVADGRHRYVMYLITEA